MLRKLVNQKPGVVIKSRMKMEELLKSPNVEFKSVVINKEKNTPFTLINNYQYRDFDREKYIRNKINFPINIPIKYRTTFDVKQFKKDIKQSKPYVDGKGRPNLAAATGNQLLVSLHNEKMYSTPEVIEMLYRLSVNKEIGHVKLQGNELLSNVIERFYKTCDFIKVEEIFEVLIYMNRIGIKDENLYMKLCKNLLVKYFMFGKFPADYFGQYFLIAEKINFFEAIGDPSKKELMISQFGRYITKMSPDVFTDLFIYCIDNNLIKSFLDPLFQSHFLMIIWKKPAWLGIKNYYRVLKGLLEFEYIKEDNEMIIEDFLPAIQKIIYKSEDVETMNKLISMLDQLTEEGVSSDVIFEYQELLYSRVLFCETKLKQIKASEFFKIVETDLKYYKMTVEDRIRRKNEKMEQNS